MDRAIEEFKIYTDSYIEISDNCVRKIDHTFRVMELCKKIALSLNLNKEDISLAMLCGLLHDIGRFEQWKRYNTFVDGKSIDHGDLGVEILTTNKFLRKFIDSEEFDSIILNSVLFHNKYNISNELSEREKLFCKIVRDADKIDILYLYTIGHLSVDTNNEIFSDDVLNSLRNNKLIERKMKKTKADTLSVSLGFVFDINFKKSIEILKKNNYINKEIDIYKEKTNNLDFINELEEVRLIINKYIESRLELC